MYVSSEVSSIFFPVKRVFFLLNMATQVILSYINKTDLIRYVPDVTIILFRRNLPRKSLKYSFKIQIRTAGKQTGTALIYLENTNVSHPFLVKIKRS